DLLRCMVEAGHTLDLEVTAEGVETPGQHRLVRELGCDVAQGFLYARPMPLDELQAWMRAPDWQGREAAG
ncbi:MAG TPA: EAL domain-containing protein, partial [Arenicellales bacterium]|nr:EAL domain-containing protein [Arenicellales bacterium]